MKPRINVVGAAIVRNGKVLALRRSGGNESVIHKFEFVGGKIEDGESPQEALARECKEELSLTIEVGDLLNTVEYEYSDFTVILSVYFVKALSTYEIKEHEEEKWIDCSELDPNDWAPADRCFLNILKTGFIKLQRADGWKDYVEISALAESAAIQMCDGNEAQEQISFTINNLINPEIIEKNIAEKEYKYKIIYLNGEEVGFYSYCPAKYLDKSYEGTFLSELFLLDFAKGKGISSKIFDSLRRPVYLVVKRSNTQAVNVFKHNGFKIVQSVTMDIGQGVNIDMFIMVCGK